MSGIKEAKQRRRRTEERDERGGEIKGKEEGGERRTSRR